MGLRVGLDGRKISPPPTGIRSLDRPARSESLYRLSYPVLDKVMPLYLLEAKMFREEAGELMKHEIWDIVCSAGADFDGIERRRGGGTQRDAMRPFQS